MRFFFPLRFKILFSLLLVVTVVVSIITFTMASIFHTDKTTYVKDFISTSASHAAMETQSLLQNYLERVKTFTRVAYDSRVAQEDKSAIFKELLADFDEMVGITFYENGVEQISVFDETALSEAGLTRTDLDAHRAANPVDRTALTPETVLVKNSTFLANFPLMTMATAVTVPGRDSPVILEALLRMDRLLYIMGQSGMLESFILEPGGGLLVHRDLERVFNRKFAAWIPKDNILDEQSNMAATFEYKVNGIDMMGSFARVQTGGLLVGMQIPQSTAFQTARSLYTNLLIVSLLLLAGATAISFFWSHRITRPLEQLTRATNDVGQGQFEIQLTPTSRDEIGSLTSSVNSMAHELKEREQSLKEAQAALIQAEKMSAFGQLSAGIAHEVKNPLAGILGYAQLALKKMEEDTPIHKNLVIIEKETRRCNSIIENLMRFARQDKPRLEPLSINDVVGDALVLVDHQLGIHEISIEKELTPDLPQIRGDANQLIQVFMNILINAQQAMDGNPGTITVTTGKAENNSIEIRFKDTGPGIGEEARKKIFEPFYTTKAAGKGTGLGLAVTYGIVKDHEGDIRVESDPGQGATFIITLPFAGEGAKSQD